MEWQKCQKSKPEVELYIIDCKVQVVVSSADSSCCVLNFPILHHLILGFWEEYKWIIFRATFFLFSNIRSFDPEMAIRHALAWQYTLLKKLPISYLNQMLYLL